FSFDGPSASLSLIQSGAFRVLAKFDPRPFPPVPDLPIITAELPKMDEITVWLGLVAPKDTPPAIVDKLQAEVAKILADPAIKAKADASGLFPATSTPAEFSAFIRKEAQRWSAVVKETGMRYDRTTQQSRRTWCASPSAWLLTAALSARVPASYASSACSRSPTRLPKELRTASAIPIARSASSCRSRLADRPTSSPACSAN